MAKRIRTCLECQYLTVTTSEDWGEQTGTEPMTISCVQGMVFHSGEPDDADCLRRILFKGHRCALELRASVPTPETMLDEE